MEDAHIRSMKTIMKKSNRHLTTGKKGEEQAANWLRHKGYKVREMNYRHKRAEIDIIVQTHEAGNDTLVFVEVKTRSSTAFGMPEEAVSESKETLILQAAEQYILQNDWPHNIRFDIVAIIIKSCGPPEITHFEDAFG